MNEPRDELDALLRPPVEVLAPPPGSFDRIRKRARQRKAARAAGGGLALVMVAGVVGSTLYFVGPTHHQVTGPPVASTHAPTVTATPTGRPSPSPSTSATPPAVVPTQGAVVPQPTSVPSTSVASLAPVPASTVPTPAVSPTTTTVTTSLCATSQLTGSLGQENAGAGNLYIPLVLTNTSTTTCHVKGYPGLSVLDAGGNQIGPAATYVTGATEDTVVLAPGESASGTIHTGLGTGTGICEPASASVRVYPPGNTASLLIDPGSVKVCDNIFTVTPFAAGTTGNPT